MSGLSGATAEWENFIASLNPAAVERERFGHPTSSERPGSPADIQARAEHEVRHQIFLSRVTLPQVSMAGFRAVLAEAAEWEKVSGRKAMHAARRAAEREKARTDP